MPLVFACVAPHGGELIQFLCPNPKIVQRFEKLRLGMEKLAFYLKQARPDTIVIASPHNLRLWKNIGISFYENSTGQLQSENVTAKKTVRVSAKCDAQLARELYDRCSRKGLPVVGANYGTFEGPTSDLPMDWGTLVPLWFFFHANSKNPPRKVSRAAPRVVIVTPSREIPLTANAEFGRQIAFLAKAKKGKRIAFVASADQAHAHSRKGPYGYHSAAGQYDNSVIEAVKENRLNSLLGLDRRIVQKASPDSLWQLAMLSGVAEVQKMNSELLCYDIPSYYGMLCAAFFPI